MHSKFLKKALIRRVLSGFFLITGGLLGTVVNGQMSTPGQFQISESGAATYTVPIQMPPGAGGMEPKLSLNYSSQANNGLLGVGWSLGGLGGISRCARTMAQDGVRGSVNFDANDRYCLDGQRLIAISGANGGDGTEYRTERESFAKIVSYGSVGNGPAWFKVWTKSGQIMSYGATSDSSIKALGKNTVRLWALNRIEDSVGNYQAISYYQDVSTGEFYPAAIDYTSSSRTATSSKNTVQFVYDGRGDITTSYMAGSLVKNTVKLTQIKMYSANVYVFSWVIGYGVVSPGDTSKITWMQMCNSENNCLPSVKYQWSPSPTGYGGERWATRAGSFAASQKWLVGDFNGDGRDDLVNVFADAAGNFTADVHINKGDRFEIQRWQSDGGWYSSDDRIFVADVNGDGKADLIHVFSDNGAISIDVYQSTGTSFQGKRWETRGGFYSAANHNILIADMDGDGRPDIVDVFNDNNLASIDVHLNNGSSFQGSRWKTQIGGFSQDQKWYAADVNGDGRADLINVFAENGNLSVDVHVNNGSGFDSSRWVNQNGWYGNDHPIFVADINGDGLADIVHVFNDQGFTSIDAYLSTGTSFVGSRWETRNSTYQGHRFFLGDATGDGLPDLIDVFNDAGSASIDVHLNSGSGFYDRRWATQMGGYWDEQRWMMLDAKGDGMASLVNVMNDQGAMSADVHPVNVSDPVGKIVSFNSLADRTITVNYRTLATASNSVYSRDTNALYPQIDLQNSIPVVSLVSFLNGSGNVNSMKYSYGGLKAEVGTGRGMLGFRWMQAQQLQTGLVSYTEYRQDWPYVGLPSLVKKSLSGGGNGGLLSQTVMSYGCNDPSASSVTPCTIAPGRRYFVFTKQSVESSWDYNGTSLPVITTSSEYDNWGNATKVDVTTDDGFKKST
ncbi:FG-GAP-like repeat-containing protein, partial [Herbaspirillum rubrisubalbicans]|uniref:FG-GAP-like repeat-containing protein n=1 Tax=Herbaspirillum rubrisubalbicans TaxID=80842 RepID=UPI00035DD219